MRTLLESTVAQLCFLWAQNVLVLGAGFHTTREEPHGLGMDCMTL